MNFVYGDSYGGVQSAEQAADSSDRQFYLGLLAAQRAAQELAMRQATQDFQMQGGMEDRVFNRALKEAQLGELTRSHQAQESLGATRANIQEAYNRGKIDVENKKLQEDDQALQREIEQAGREGEALSKAFNEALQGKTATDTTFDQAQERLRQLDTQGRTLESRQALKWDKASKSFKAALPDYTGAALALNKAIRESIDTLGQADEARRAALKNLQGVQKQAYSAGFMPDPTGAGLIHTPTGLQFPFANQPNSARVRRYNPQTRSLE